MPALIEACATHPRLTALALGIVCAAGFQPLRLWPLALLALGAFALLLSQAVDVRRAALLGWLFGLAHFTVGNSWIATAFTYQAEMPAILGWFAVPLLAVYLAVYPAIGAAAARALAGRGFGSVWVLAFAGCWIVSEWLRGWVFTGFAWNPFGVILLGGYDSPGLAALLPWIGTYALSGLAVFLGTALVLLIAERRFVPLGIVAALLAVGMALPAGRPREGTLPFTLVQPDLRQEDIVDPTKFEGQFANIAGLSLPRGAGQRRLVLWPESGVPDYLRDGYPQRYYDQTTVAGDPAFARARIGQVIGPGSVLLTGAVDLEIAGGRAVGARNAVTAIDAQGRILGGYDKAHLVPYGEYLALRWLIEPLGGRRLVAGALDFWPGLGPRTLHLGRWGNAGVQICYEIIFSGEVVNRSDRPDFIFNPSNDGWFGVTGPPQFLAQSRLRAIEEGLPVLRATTTGISAVIDARGVVRQHIGKHRAARLDGMIPPAAAPTPFGRFGNLLPLGWAVAFLLAAMVALRLRRV